MCYIYKTHYWLQKPKSSVFITPLKESSQVFVSPPSDHLRLTTNPLSKRINFIILLKLRSESADSSISVGEREEIDLSSLKDTSIGQTDILVLPCSTKCL